MSKYTKLLLGAMLGVLVAVLFITYALTNLTNRQADIMDIDANQLTASDETISQLDDEAETTIDNQDVEQYATIGELSYGDEIMYWHCTNCCACFTHSGLFHSFHFFIHNLVSEDDFTAWYFATTAMDIPCLVNIVTFIEHFGISRGEFQDFIDLYPWHYFMYGGNIIDVIFSGDNALINHFFSIENHYLLAQQRREREAKYWSERVVIAQQRVHANTTGMSWYFHDIWTYIYFSDDLGWYYQMWMQDLVASGEYDSVNISEFINHFRLYRDSLSPGKTIFEHWATHDNMNIYTHYNFEVLLSGDPARIREYYSIQNEPTHTSQVQARLQQHTTAQGAPDTTWMIPRGHRLIFNLNNNQAQGDFPPQLVTIGTAPSEPSGIPTRQGFMFTGWYTAETDGTAFDFSTPITSHTTIYAQWATIDRDALYAAIAKAEARTQQNYTSQSWTNLQQELESARSAYQNQNATQEQIITAADRLLTAIASLAEAATSTPGPSSPGPSPTPRPDQSRSDGSYSDTATPSTPRPSPSPAPARTPTPTPSPSPLNNDAEEAILPLLRFEIGSLRYTYNGIPMMGDAAPFIVGDRAHIPLRIIAEALGAEVTWNNATRTGYMTKGGTTIRIVVDAPLPGGMGTPVILNSRTFVPARYISETFGATVRWDNDNAAVYVYRPVAD